MPLYMCNALGGAISEEAKPKIASDITRIHCAVTDAPPQFVHAFFFEDGDHQPAIEKSASFLGSIRKGRTDEQKAQIVSEITHSIHEHAGIPLDEIGARILETPASWVMEGGDIFPEPGEEAAWLVEHEAKLAAQSSD